MLDPEVEARFRRIEDAQLVAAELLRRSEKRTEDFQEAVIGWVEQQERWRQEQERWRQEHERWRAEIEAKMAALVDTVAELARLYRYRTDGQEN